MGHDAAADPHDLARFLTAQEGTFDTACEELRNGRKHTHWIWFIFPQIEGLGSSETARRYAIRSLDEAKAYAGHPVLGQRLLEATEAALGSGVRNPFQLFGSPDDMKFRSSMTLFSIADPDQRIFKDALNVMFDGKADPRTVESPIIKAHI